MSGIDIKYHKIWQPRLGLREVTSYKMLSFRTF